MTIKSMFDSKEVKAGGQTFVVHELSVKQRANIYDEYKKDSDAVAMSASLIVMGCEQFSGKSIEDVYELPGKVFDILSTAVADVSGMGASKDDDNDDEEGKKKP